MFWPFLNEPSKDNKIDKTGVNVSYRIGALKIIVEMMQFLYDVILYVFLILRFVFAGVEIEYVRSGIVAMLEDPQLLYL